MYLHNHRANQTHSTPRRTGESRYPDLIFRVILPYVIPAKAGIHRIHPHTVIARRALARRSNLIKVRVSPSQNSSAFAAPTPRRTGESRYPDLIFRVILPYVIPAKAGIHRIHLYRHCEDGFSRTKQSHKSSICTFTIIERIKHTLHHVIPAKAGTQI